MSQYRNINYPSMLYESMRNYFAINANGLLTILYRYCLSIIYPISQTWDDFETFRKKELIIAQCKWQHAQLVNVLNELFDTELKRITITETVSDTVYVPNIAIDTTVFLPNITKDTTVFVPDIDDPFLFLTKVVFNVPASIYADTSEISAVIEQINIGIPYKFASL